MENEIKEKEINEEKVENIEETTTEPAPIFPTEETTVEETKSAPAEETPKEVETLKTEKSVIEEEKQNENKETEMMDDEPIVDVVDNNQIEKSFFAAEEIPSNEEPVAHEKEVTSFENTINSDEKPKMIEEPVGIQEITPKTEELPKPIKEGKKTPLVTILLIILIILVGVGIAVLFMYLNKSDNNNEIKPVVDEQKQAFLDLANKYVTAAEVLWNSDSIICQNGTNQQELLKPSELSDTDAYSGPAYYYLFINTQDNTEMNLGVEKERDVAGWIRIGKTDKSFYVALSDGANYIIDKGTEFGVKSTSLTANDVITTGNGNNYQYMNGQIFGSNTDGNGWGIGDYVLLTDGDDTNNGIYMTNGLKTSGWTPYCSNIK